MIELLRKYIERKLELSTIVGPVNGKLKSIIHDRILVLDSNYPGDHEIVYVEVDSIKAFNVLK